MVYSGDLALSEPFNACGEGKMDMSGRIALAIRDKSQTNCSFAMKVFNVESVNGLLQESGAIGVVIMNEKPLRWEEDELVRMGEDEKNTFNVGNGDVCDG